VSTQLRIYWDGKALGLEEGRFSLAAFGPALLSLLRAARNIARRQVAAATGESYDPEKATKQTLVDLQLSAYRSGSADQTLEVVPVASQHAATLLFPDFAERITRELFAAIRDESRGIRKDRFVNEYLHALPKGVKVQRYTVVINGQAEEPLELTEMRLLEPVESYPALVQLRGIVDAVGFGEAGRPEVRFIPWEGTPVKAAATKEQVELAVKVRKAAVALVLMGHEPKLLWIRADTDTNISRTPKEREDHIFAKWADLLGRLAQ
jgi:hypothetical protein